MGWFNTSSGFASAVVPLVCTSLAVAFGSWRPVFYVLSIPGIIGILLLWKYISDRPEELFQKKRVSKAEDDFSQDGLVSHPKVDAAPTHASRFALFGFCTRRVLRENNCYDEAQS